MPGTPALNQGGDAAVTLVSCAAASHCRAGGDYKNDIGRYQVFVDSET